MLITGIKLDGISTVTFPIVGLTASSPYILKQVDGLGPPEIDVIMSTALHQDSIHQNSTSQSREIVMRVGLQPNFAMGQTAAQLREGLYWLLEPQATNGITVSIMNGSTVVAKTTAFPKRFETVPWSKTPEIQITLECTRATLQGPAEISTTHASANVSIFAQGSARAPAITKIQVLKTIQHVQLYRSVGTGPSLEYVAAAYYPFLANDIIEFDSTPGSRRITRQRGSEYISLMGYLAPGSTWPVVDPIVENVFKAQGVASTVGDPTATRITNIRYTPRFWGI